MTRDPFAFVRDLFATHAQAVAQGDQHLTRVSLAALNMERNALRLEVDQ